MLVYIIVLAVAVIGLYVCYRAFGGSQAAGVDVMAHLDTAAASLRSTLQALDEVLAPHHPPTDAEARAGRLALGAAQHCLDTLPAETELDERAQHARALLVRAVEDLSWAWRMVGTPSWADNSGVINAATSLRDDAERCGNEAAGLLGDPLLEPGKGSH